LRFVVNLLTYSGDEGERQEARDKATRNKSTRAPVTRETRATKETRKIR
jgi:hypothetical protein